MAVETMANVTQRHSEPPASQNQIRRIRIIRRPRQIGSQLTDRTTLLPISPPRVGTLEFRQISSLVRMDKRRRQQKHVRLGQTTMLKVGTRYPDRTVMTILRHACTISQVRIGHNFRAPLVRPSRGAFQIKRRNTIPNRSNPP